MLIYVGVRDSSDYLDSLPNELKSPSHEQSFGGPPYNGTAVIVFSVIGLILQVPVIYTHCGLFSEPNVPVVLMSLFYFYFMLSSTISAVYWTHGDMTHWWDGKGWCDVASRLNLALSLGILSAQCVINVNIISMLQFRRPQKPRWKQMKKRILWQLAACLALPVLNLAVSTFTTYTRYQVLQNFGCAATLDSSVAVIITNFMWIPLLGAIALLTMLFIAFKFWQQGTNKTLQYVSFVPNMSGAQFVRVIVFACVITFILAPLSAAVAVINFISIRKSGTSELAWAHGKPSEWDEIIMTNFAILKLVGNSTLHSIAILNSITLYVNIAISWLVFLCYGTGVMATKAYKAFLIFIVTLHGRYNLSLGSEIRDWGVYRDDQESENTFNLYSSHREKDHHKRTSSSAIHSGFSHSSEISPTELVNLDLECSPEPDVSDYRVSHPGWDVSVNGSQNFKRWEARFSKQIDPPYTGESTSFTLSPSTAVDSLTDPEERAQPPPGPAFPIGNFLGSKPFFNQKK